MGENLNSIKNKKDALMGASKERGL